MLRDPFWSILFAILGFAALASFPIINLATGVTP